VRELAVRSAQSTDADEACVAAQIDLALDVRATRVTLESSAMPPAERVREVRERLFADGAVVARADGGRRDLFPVAIGLEEGLSLSEWVRKEQALSTLETGLGYGISTLFICEACSRTG
jgi:hypothetical protein